MWNGKYLLFKVEASRIAEIAMDRAGGAFPPSFPTPWPGPALPAWIALPGILCRPGLAAAGPATSGLCACRAQGQVLG